MNSTYIIQIPFYLNIPSLIVPSILFINCSLILFINCSLFINIPSIIVAKPKKAFCDDPIFCKHVFHRLFSFYIFTYTVDMRLDYYKSEGAEDMKTEV